MGKIYAFFKQEPIQFVCLPVLPDVRTTCGDHSPQTLKVSNFPVQFATALHLAAQNSYPRCNQFPNCWSLLKDNKSLVAGFDQKLKMSFNHEVIFRASDGGTNTKTRCSAGSTTLHYVSCGGVTQCY
ncbi:hypothetical protein Bca52824_073403 [Brassica carinata]|uniref:Uncharacterized protein n=1 Tax=Brassica carinata TaxID=52824 RepID=A0A8X7U5T9_BRACI|nr:hypothetical protein Bca52824_073403 [Brassica carinata]